MVILPAFGVTVADMARLVDQGCTLVDTTCGSVLNVWKNVVRYAQDGFTSVIHGKVRHEETRATASQALKYPGGSYLVVLDRDEAQMACDYIRRGGDSQEFLNRFRQAVSPGFDPDRDLERVGCANQTTMLMSESLEIGDMFRAAMVERYGEADLPRHLEDSDARKGGDADDDETSLDSTDDEDAKNIREGELGADPQLDYAVDMLKHWQDFKAAAAPPRAG